MLYLEISAKVPAGMKKSQVNSVMREGYARVGAYWIKHYLPRHFKRGNAQRYNHDPRKPAYLKRRATMAALRGEVSVDLVYTGDTRASALRGARATATATLARIKIPAPRLNRRPHLVRELTTLAADEIKKLTEVMSREIKTGLQRAMQERKRAA